ncbi:MAG: radical SAM protein [Candidatus Gottesmanbacteria bacterium]
MIIDINTIKPKRIINRVRLLYSFISKKPYSNGLPLEVGIEIINKCNLRCIMCPYQDMIEHHTRPQKQMDFTLFKKIIDEISSFVELVYLHGLGEPLLHPQLWDFIKYAKEKGLRVGISTNATLLTKKQSVALLNSTVDYLILALDGSSKTTYEKIRVGANFQQVENNINTYLNLKRQSKKSPFTVLQFITLNENEKEKELFSKKWRIPGVDAIRIKSKIDLRQENRNHQIEIDPYCFHLYRMLNILSDGTVVPCCNDIHGVYPLGNLQNDHLITLWNNEKMAKLRKINFQRQRQKIDLCRNCSYPQPTLIEIIGVLTFDHLTVKKLLSLFENSIISKIL